MVFQIVGASELQFLGIKFQPLAGTGLAGGLEGLGVSLPMVARGWV